MSALVVFAMSGIDSIGRYLDGVINVSTDCSRPKDKCYECSFFQARIEFGD
jgi:hypothetical protein